MDRPARPTVSPSPRAGRSRAWAITRPWLTAALLAAVFASAHGETAKADKSKKAAVATPEIAEKQADLGELRSRIESLRKDLHSSEENRADAADKLRESERRISALQRELRELSEQRNALQNRLRTLESQSQELAGTLNQQQAQLENLLYRQYLRGTPDTTQFLLNGGNPNQMARDLYYLSAIGLARAELIGEIHANIDRKKTLAADAKERADELAEVEMRQQQRHQELKKQQE